MGTNFYKIDEDKPDLEGDHIGKRSAAGVYCEDCGISLCIYGDYWIHRGTHNVQELRFYNRDKSEQFPDLYPKQIKIDDSETELEYLLQSSDVMFFKKCPTCGKEVDTTTCSFTWASVPYKTLQWLRTNADIISVIDEYGTSFTANEFLKELEDCKIKYYHLIGDDFS